jgi:3'(2'), 5'-bisphosphate nucleotidase
MPAESDHALATRLAEETGQLLLQVRAHLFDQRAHPWDVMDIGDREAHRYLVRALAEFRPTDAVLSEEGVDDQARLTAQRVWIVDPLDGSNEFGEPDRPDWAVHVALVANGSPIAGAVSLPALGITLGTDPAPVLPDAVDRPVRVVSSRFRIPRVAQRIAQRLDAEIWPLGSAGAKAMAVVLGHADIYAHAGGQYEWDNCAPAAVALASGLHASRIDGSPLIFNKPDAWSPDVLICRPELADACLRALWS